MRVTPERRKGQWELFVEGLYALREVCKDKPTSRNTLDSCSLPLYKDQVSLELVEAVNMISYNLVNRCDSVHADKAVRKLRGLLTVLI